MGKAYPFKAESQKLKVAGRMGDPNLGSRMIRQPFYFPNSWKNRCDFSKLWKIFFQGLETCRLAGGWDSKRPVLRGGEKTEKKT